MFWIILCLAVLAILVGARAVRLQFFTGLSTTGLSNRFSWGIYIQGFLALGSLAGGVLFLAGLSGLLMDEAPLAPLAGAVALGCLAGGGILIAADLGKPFRSILLALGRNTGSTMTWDFYTFALCGLLALAAIVYALCDALPGAVWSMLTLIISGAFLLMHVLLLLARQESPVNQPFLALELFLRALWGGTALLALLTLHAESEFDLSYLLLALSLFVTLVHIVSQFAKQRPENASIFFWINKALLADMVVVLALLIGVYAELPLLSGLAALAAILLLAWEKMRLVRAFQTQSVLPAPYSKWEPATPYKPSALELQICLGALGLAILVGMIALLLIL